MYKIDTGQARTDLFEVGKRAFQVAPDDHSAERLAEAKAARKEKADVAAEAKVNAQLGALHDSINPRDRNHFANISKDFIAGTEANIDKLKAGDPTAWSQFLTAKADVNQEIDTSNSYYKDLLKKQNMVASKGEGSYYQETLGGLNNANNPENEGKYDNIPMPIEQPKIAPDQYALARKTQLMNTTDTNGHPLKKDVSRQEADSEAVNLAHTPEYTYHFMRQVTPSNPAALPENELNKLQVASDYDAKGNPTKMLKLTNDDNLLKNNPDEYAPASIENVAKAQVGKQMEGHWQKEPSAGLLNQTKNQPIVTHVVDKDGSGTIQFELPADKKDEIQAFIPDPNDPKSKVGVQLNSVEHDSKGKIIGGTATTVLTPGQVQENNTIKSENRIKQAAYDSALFKAKQLRSKLGNGEKALKAVDAILPRANDPEYKQEPLKYTEGTIYLNPNVAQEISHDKYNVKPAEIIKGNTGGVNYQKIRSQQPATSKDNSSSGLKTIKVNVDGQLGEIPVENWENLKKKHPSAKQVQ